MNRREFLGYCVAAGTSFGLGGFSASANPIANLLSAEVNFPEGLVVADPHAHPYQLQGGRQGDASTPTVELMKQTGLVVCAFATVGDMVKFPGRSGSPYADTLKQLQAVIRLQKKQQVRPILKTGDVQAAVKDRDAPGALMAIEGGDALEGSIKKLEEFYELGVRMITLMHESNNEIGFNQRSSADGPLTSFGIRVVEKMNQSGMIIDVAHAKTKTLKSIAEISAAPLIDSHSNPLLLGFETAEPTRLRSWPEMELIVKSGGLIGTWPLAYERKSQQRTTFKHWAEEILLMKSRFGIEHCGLGTDSGGNLPQKIRGWESYASLPHLILAMQEAGLSQTDIAAYLGGNFLRFLEKGLG